MRVAEGRVVKQPMNPELWRRLKPLYEVALEQPKERRAEFIVEVCGDDSELRAELTKLVEASERSTLALPEPILDIRNLMTFSEPPLADGTVLDDQFRIVRHLGSGGMGDVYEAVDLQLESGRIAVKVIRSDLARNPLILARFREEVKLARKVTGPNICRVHELHVPLPGSNCPCVAFLTMEFLEGVTLASRIAPDNPLPVKDASSIALQICEALQVIHDAGIVHRDLKPRNIMLVPRNETEKVVLMDFGVASALNATGNENAGLTQPGAIVGTPDYMAPEQFEGNQASRATDIYALGIVLYEVFTGQHPFAASTPYGMAVRRGRHPESPSSIRNEIPPAWDGVIAKCLEYKPERRYQSANLVLEALRQHFLVLWRFRSGRRIALTTRMTVIAASLILLVLGVSGLFAYRELKRYRPSPEAQFWYDRASVALREGTYFVAVKEFKMALDRDPKFSLAHASLADAFGELDFSGQAEREILIATSSSQVDSLSDRDKAYLEAVRNTLIRNYSAAVQNYEAILNQLPGNQKGPGYVDLGRAYEKAGRVKETIASYQKAAQLMPHNPAPFVHLGIWESRQRDRAAAAAAFAKAEQLYETNSNMEGLAEVAYQKGYAANEAADSNHAREYLNKSLALAREIPNVQLEVRTLSQLSSVAYNDSSDPAGDDKSIELANEAIELARDNDLEYWSTDGLVRLANAYLDKGDLSTAESRARQALRFAKQNQHPRLEASANLTLASIRDRQGNSVEQIAFAQSALKYYRDFGFMNSAAQASILIARAEEAQEDYARAIKTGGELLEIATKSGSEISIENAEDVLGVAAFGLEDYPAALTHYEGAMESGRKLHADEGYQELGCADALWRLGRYSEAETMLARASSGPDHRMDLARSIAAIRARMELSRERFHDAIAVSRRAREAYTGFTPDQMIDLQISEAAAEARLGNIDRAEQETEHLLAFATNTGRPALVAEAQLVGAEIYLWLRSPQKAIELAGVANQYASSKGLKESQWLNLSVLAGAHKQLGDNSASESNAKKAIDILNNLEQSWGSSVFHLYSTRPDHKSALRDLTPPPQVNRE